jgi:hypothetical protein
LSVVRRSFDSYKLWYYSNFSYECLVYCYLDEQYVGRIVFYTDDSVPDSYMFPGDIPSIHYPISKFQDVMGILRHESPLYLFLNIDKHIGIIGTEDFEPTGEMEDTDSS